MTATRIGKRVLSNAFVDLLSERVLTVLNSLSLSREDIKGRCRSRCTGIAEEDRRRGRSTGREIAPWFFFFLTRTAIRERPLQGQSRTLNDEGLYILANR
jgi:hypothetical protein